MSIFVRKCLDVRGRNNVKTNNDLFKKKNLNVDITM